MKKNILSIFLFLSSFFVMVQCIGQGQEIIAEPKKGKNCEREIPGMKCIPGGEFVRGSNSYDADEKPEARIFVSEFYMDTNEVTNEEFNRCLEAGKCKTCLKEKTCTYVGAKYGKLYQGPKQPVAGAPWYSAKEYCEFVGKRLPTESEWEKAARGPDGNIFPWGNEPATCERAIIEDEQGRKGCVPKKLSPPNLMPTQDVGSKAPGAYGLYDMAGNSWEWVSDWYVPYSKCGEDCFEKDPKGPCKGADTCPGMKYKVLKSGSWWWPARYARGSKRRYNDPGFKEQYHHFGFRCAKDA
jgi:formylglycine-generating enzyme